MKPPFTLPPRFWLAVAIASFVASFASWQDQRLDRLRPPAAGLPAEFDPTRATPPAMPANSIEPLPASAPAAPVTDLSAPGAPAADAAEPAAVRRLEPQAGRQVLRCVSRGRVTYRDLNAGCPEGASQTITVFPTEGVGRPQ